MVRREVLFMQNLIIFLWVFGEAARIGRVWDGGATGYGVGVAVVLGSDSGDRIG